MAEFSDDKAKMQSGRVLRFRPRTSMSAPYSDDKGTPSTQNAAENPPDDFRHRMMVNAAGLACAVTLTAAGIWLASSISNLRHTQDCVLSGRRDCAPIATGDQQSATLRQH